MKTLLSKPKGLAPEYSAQFGDASMARAYQTRPAYALELFDLLLQWIRDAPSVVLDLGCGRGDISRRLASLYSEQEKRNNLINAQKANRRSHSIFHL